MDVDEVQQPGSSAAAAAAEAEAAAHKQKEKQKQQRKYGDAVCGYGSDDEPPTFSDAEDAVLGVGSSGAAAERWAKQHTHAAGSDGAAASEQQLQEWRERFRGNAGGLAALEQVASASTSLFMDAQGALACLCGRAGRYLVRRAAVSLGRSTDSKGDVDVDLAREGAAAKVSRLQAQLLLQPDGAFVLHNVGRRSVMVNGATVSCFGVGETQGRGRAGWGMCGETCRLFHAHSRGPLHCCRCCCHTNEHNHRWSGVSLCRCLTSACWRLAVCSCCSCTTPWQCSVHWHGRSSLSCE